MTLLPWDAAQHSKPVLSKVVVHQSHRFNVEFLQYLMCDLMAQPRVRERTTGSLACKIIANFYLSQLGRRT